MELGNVYEVFQIGDRVRVNDICYVYYGRTGTIVQIEDISYNTEPIYTIRLDETRIPFDDHAKPQTIRVNAKSLEKILRREPEEETVTVNIRNGKTYLTQIGKFKNKDNGFDSVIYEMEKMRKFTEGSNNTMKKIDVEKIIFNGFKTIVFWNDGTKTIVSMSQEEINFDPEDAFRAAYTKKMYGTNSKIKRIIAEKSNIEQHQRIAKEKLKEEMEKISRDCDKYMKENYPWMYESEEKKPEKQQDDERPIKFCQCSSRNDISKDRAVEAPVGHKFKVGDGVAVSSMCSPYIGRGGKIVAITQKHDDGSIRYTVEFYEPGNPGHSYTYDFSECQLTYDPTWAWNENSKKSADAFAAFLDTIFNCGDSGKEKKDDEN